MTPGRPSMVISTARRTACDSTRSVCSVKAATTGSALKHHEKHCPMRLGRTRQLSGASQRMFRFACIIL